MNKRIAVLLVSALFCVCLSPSAHAFSDIDQSPYGEAISYAVDKGMVKGYEDGTFKPLEPMNRAEFLKVLLGDKDVSEVNTNCFPDVDPNAWFAPYVCLAKEEGMISGYPDGTFHPENNVSLPEVAKIMTGYYELVPSVYDPQAPWYMSYLSALESGGYLPETVQSIGQPMARDEIVELIWRIATQRNDLATVKVASLSTEVCTPLRLEEYEGVDIAKVRDTWLAWYNAERAKVGAQPLELDGDLIYTARAWSERAADRGTIDHKRENNTYYDYFAIRRWFASFGLTFPSRGGSTFGESIAWNVYPRCTGDCTDSLTSAIRSSFNFFVGEKGRAYSPHYDMMVNPSYKYMGVGIALDPGTRKYYLTSHFATEVKKEGQKYCLPR